MKCTHFLVDNGFKNLILSTQPSKRRFRDGSVFAALPASRDEVFFSSPQGQPVTLGFTGTTHGMTPRQLKAVRQLLQHANVLHLGDCIGADDAAYAQAIFLGIKTVGHPPSVGKSRAFCDYDEERPLKSYLVRNRDIVSEGIDGLIAAPKGYAEERRSGTWATVRYARRAGRRVWIVWPDGKISEEAEHKCDRMDCSIAGEPTH